MFSLSSPMFYQDLSNNSLNGTIPPKLGKLKNLGYLSLSGNKLSDKIPATLGDCPLLEFVDLHNNILSGTIPPSLSNVKDLRHLDLSNNNLSGPIPKVLQDLNFLVFLNLSINHLQGDVPITGVFRNTSLLSVNGNDMLCGGVPELHLHSCPDGRSFNKMGWSPLLKTAILAISSALIIVMLFFYFFVYWQIRKQRKITSPLPSMDSRHLKISYQDLVTATDGFSSSNLINKGAHTTLYKGTLPKTPIAIKVFKLQKRGALKSFVAECKTLGSCRHRNLVEILASCSTANFKVLVFEFMPNGNLDSWLHPQMDGNGQYKSLSLLQRLKIAADVANVLDYLHNDCPSSIVHCDLKPQNVLLDHQMNARLVGFGSAKIIPEHRGGGQLSTEGDVYNYGILLLEMFTGKRPVHDMFNDGLSLRQFVKMAFSDGVMEIADPRLVWANDKSNCHECLASVLKIGLLCSNRSPKQQINMRDVARMINHIRNSYLGLDKDLLVFQMEKPIFDHSDDGYL